VIFLSDTLLIFNLVMNEEMALYLESLKVGHCAQACWNKLWTEDERVKETDGNAAFLSLCRMSTSIIMCMSREKERERKKERKLLLAQKKCGLPLSLCSIDTPYEYVH
jgi:hypothetical protein